MVLLRMLLITVNREVSLVEILEAFSDIEDAEGIREVEVFPSMKEGPPHFLVSVLFEAEVEKGLSKKDKVSEVAKVLAPVGYAMSKMDFIKEANGYFFDASHYYHVANA